MPKLTMKEKVALIKTYRDKIQRLEIEQGKLFNKVVKQLRVNKEPDITRLFDYLYNTSKVTPSKMAGSLWPDVSTAKEKQT
jgi:hypothetical protein